MVPAQLGEGVAESLGQINLWQIRLDMCLSRNAPIIQNTHSYNAHKCVRQFRTTLKAWVHNELRMFRKKS